MLLTYNFMFTQVPGPLPDQSDANLVAINVHDLATVASFLWYIRGKVGNRIHCVFRKRFLCVQCKE